MTDARRWELLADAVAVGDRLPDDDARFVDAFDDADVQAEREVYDTLAELGHAGAVSEEDITTAQTLLVARRGGGSRRRGWGIGVAVMAAAAILVLAIGVPQAISWTRDANEGSSAGGLLSDVDGREAEVHDATQESRRTQSGGARDRGGEASVESATEEPDDVRIEDEPPAEAAEVAPVRSPRNHEPPPAAGELLARARELVLAGAETKALAVYERLRRAHPGSSEAHVANVSIGEIQLQRGKASAALAAFDRYLAGGGGSLREEALWGRVRALHRLGRVDARDEAAGRLRKTFPKSVYLSRLPR